VGPLEEARKQINRALELDPLSMIIHVIKAIIYYNSGELDMALKENLKVLEFDQNRANRHWSMFVIYREQHKHKEAFKELRKYWSMDSSTVKYPELTEGIYHEAGIDGVIRWWMDTEVKKSPNASFIARHYAILGEKELALEWLEKSFELNANYTIKEDRMFESLRSEPRFIAILEKMGLDADYDH
jgi:tetratricopeptide (TPR) repeat protein